MANASVAPPTPEVSVKVALTGVVNVATFVSDAPRVADVLLIVTGIPGVAAAHEMQVVKSVQVISLNSCGTPFAMRAATSPAVTSATVPAVLV